MNTNTLYTPLNEVVLVPAAVEEAAYRSRRSFGDSETGEAVKLDLAKRLSRHQHFDERTICAEFQRSILVVTRGMDFD